MNVLFTFYMIALGMTLFDRVCHAYIRQLANRSVSVKHSKLNILVSLFLF